MIDERRIPPPAEVEQLCAAVQGDLIAWLQRHPIWRESPIVVAAALAHIWTATLVATLNQTPADLGIVRKLIDAVRAQVEAATTPPAPPQGRSH